MHFRSRDYRAIIDDLVFKEKRLFADAKTMKLPNKLNDETLLSTKPFLR